MVEKGRIVPIDKLAHFSVRTADLAASRRFYVEVLGMEVLNRANEDLVYLTCGNDNLSLGRGAGAANGLQTLDHYGFIVDSVEELEAWYQYFKAHGVTLLDRPFNHGDGARSFHLLDPAGNKVQPLYHPAVSGQRLV